jgi:hypothetical protein
MKKAFKSGLNWIKGIFDKDSSVSSKRLMGVLMVVWALSVGTYFIVMKSSQSTESRGLIEFALMTGAGLLGAGTLFEGLSNKKKSDES